MGALDGILARGHYLRLGKLKEDTKKSNCAKVLEPLPRPLNLYLLHLCLPLPLPMCLAQAVID